MPQEPRPYLNREEIEALPEDEKRRAIAEWSSHIARIKREREEQASRGAYRGSYRGTRGRGMRGRGGYYNYQPYPWPTPSRPYYANPSTAFGQAERSSTPSVAMEVQPIPASSPINAKENDKIDTPCAVFTATGTCSRPRCRHVHDPEKTAICKHFLFKNNCSNGDACPLSHTPSPHRSPGCVHFQNGNCTKDDCRYAHVHVNPAAPVCEAFARLGYCEKGDTCADRHAFECPDFTNKGACEVKGCRLPHVVHAGRLRKAVGSGSSSDAEPSSAPSSPEIVGEKMENIANADPSITGNNTLLSQQADYVPFES